MDLAELLESVLRSKYMGCIAKAATTQPTDSVCSAVFGGRWDIIRRLLGEADNIACIGQTLNGFLEYPEEAGTSASFSQPQEERYRREDPIKPMGTVNRDSSSSRTSNNSTKIHDDDGNDGNISMFLNSLRVHLLRVRLARSLQQDTILEQHLADLKNLCGEACGEFGTTEFRDLWDVVGKQGVLAHNQQRHRSILAQDAAIISRAKALLQPAHTPGCSSGIMGDIEGCSSTHARSGGAISPLMSDPRQRLPSVSTYPLLQGLPGRTQQLDAPSSLLNHHLTSKVVDTKGCKDSLCPTPPPLPPVGDPADVLSLLVLAEALGMTAAVKACVCFVAVEEVAIVHAARRRFGADKFDWASAVGRLAKLSKRISMGSSIPQGDRSVFPERRCLYLAAHPQRPSKDGARLIGSGLSQQPHGAEESPHRSREEEDGRHRESAVEWQQQDAMQHGGAVAHAVTVREEDKGKRKNKEAGEEEEEEEEVINTTADDLQEAITKELRKPPLDVPSPAVTGVAHRLTCKDQNDAAADHFEKVKACPPWHSTQDRPRLSGGASFPMAFEMASPPPPPPPPLPPPTLEPSLRMTVRDQYMQRGKDKKIMPQQSSRCACAPSDSGVVGARLCLSQRDVWGIPASTVSGDGLWVQDESAPDDAERVESRGLSNEGGNDQDEEDEECEDFPASELSLSSDCEKAIVCDPSHELPRMRPSDSRLRRYHVRSHDSVRAEETSAGASSDEREELPSTAPTMASRANARQSESRSALTPPSSVQVDANVREGVRPQCSRRADLGIHRRYTSAGSRSCPLPLRARVNTGALDESPARQRSREKSPRGVSDSKMELATMLAMQEDESSCILARKRAQLRVKLARQRCSLQRAVADAEERRCAADRRRRRDEKVAALLMNTCGEAVISDTCHPRLGKDADERRSPHDGFQPRSRAPGIHLGGTGATKSRVFTISSSALLTSDREPRLSGGIPISHRNGRSSKHRGFLSLSSCVHGDISDGLTVGTGTPNESEEALKDAEGAEVPREPLSIVPMRQKRPVNGLRLESGWRKLNAKRCSRNGVGPGFGSNTSTASIRQVAVVSESERTPPSTGTEDTVESHSCDTFCPRTPHASLLPPSPLVVRLDTLYTLPGQRECFDGGGASGDSGSCNREAPSRRTGVYLVLEAGRLRHQTAVQRPVGCIRDDRFCAEARIGKSNEREPQDYGSSGEQENGPPIVKEGHHGSNETNRNRSRARDNSKSQGAHEYLFHETVVLRLAVNEGMHGEQALPDGSLRILVYLSSRGGDLRLRQKDGEEGAGLRSACSDLIGVSTLPLRRLGGERGRGTAGDGLSRRASECTFSRPVEVPVLSHPEGAAIAWLGVGVCGMAVNIPYKAHEMEQEMM